MASCKLKGWQRRGEDAPPNSGDADEGEDDAPEVSLARLWVGFVSAATVVFSYPSDRKRRQLAAES